ncbi:MAG: hypothetical protein ACE5HQ_13135 [Gemmatimonadota bacterium]
MSAVHVALLREVANRALPSAAALASDMGISYHTWRSWLTGRRTPSRGNLLALSLVLKENAAALADLAERVSQLADTRD